MIIPAQLLRKIPDLIVPFHEQTKSRGMTFGLGPAGYDIRAAERVVVTRETFVRAAAIERFSLPLDVLGQVCDKSTWARRGIAVQNTIIEPGWRGYLTLELTNHGIVDMVVEAGDPIAQVLFFRLECDTEQPYAGKYQDQPPGPQPALMEPMGAQSLSGLRCHECANTNMIRTGQCWTCATCGSTTGCG